MDWDRQCDEEYVELMEEWPQAAPYIERSYDIDRQLGELRERLDVLEGKPQLPKAVTPIEQTIVVHKSAEESAASILEMIGQKRKEAEQAQKPTTPQTIQ